MLLLYICFVSSSFLGIDFGTNFIKVAALLSSSKIEIVLNEQTKRKTPAMVSFKGNYPITSENAANIQRRIGISAQKMLLSNSSSVIRGFTHFIGKKETDELKSYLKEKHYDFEIRNTRINGVEEYIAIAMLLEHMVQHSNRQNPNRLVQGVVISVPGFFTQSQREILIQAAELAEIRILRIIDEKEALSLLYALEKSSNYAYGPQKVVFIDMGASTTTISGFEFSNSETNGKNIPKINELFYIWDDQLGGYDYDLRIAEYLMNEYHLESITQSLLYDAERIKEALSLSDEVNISCESIGKRIIFTKDTFDYICQSLYQRFSELLRSIPMKVDSIELIGGSSRISSLQDIIRNNIGEYSRSLNADESIAIGAAYAAGSASGIFRMTKVETCLLSTHSINLVTNSKNISLYQSSSSFKSKTARIEPVKHFSLVYSSKIPIGCDKVIIDWEIFYDSDFQSDSRVTLSFGFDDTSMICLKKSLIYSKTESNQVIQSHITTRVKTNEFNQSDFEKQIAKRLFLSFKNSESKNRRIAEARNSLESLLFETKGKIIKGGEWFTTISSDERQILLRHIDSSINWLEKNPYFDNEDELVERRKEFFDKIQRFQIRNQLISAIYSAKSSLLNSLNALSDRIAKLKASSLIDHATVDNMYLSESLEWVKETLGIDGNISIVDDAQALLSEIDNRNKKICSLLKKYDEL